MLSAMSASAEARPPLTGSAPRPGRVRWSDRRRFTTWYAAFAVFAAGTALSAGYPVQVSWGVWAAGGYTAAALAAWLWRSRGLGAAIIVSLAGALAGPLIWQVTAGRTMSRVGEGALTVVARSGGLLLQHGTPYLQTAQLTHPLSYDPYLPLMAAFGLPGAAGLPGWAGNPRLWFAVLGVAGLALAFRLAAPGRTVRWTGFAFASPVIAFQLVCGASDVPVIVLLVLALACAARPSLGWAAAVAVGAACAIKATAWPAILVLAALYASRDGARAAVRFSVISVTSAAALVIAAGPAAFARPGQFLQNTVLYPLGLTHAQTMASSPLPGHLLAATGSAGHWASVGLLAAAGLAIAASLVLRPPSGVAAATRRLALGLALMFVLGPASRWGYFAYPVALLGWLALTEPGAEPAGPAAADPAVPQSALSH
jgi:hypothetical protein